MAEIITVKNFRDHTTALSDGTAVTPLDYTLNIVPGSFKYDDPGHDEILIRDQGEIAGTRKGNANPITGSYQAYFRQFTDGSEDALIDFIKAGGNLAAMVTTGTNAFKDFVHVDLVHTVEGTDFGDSADHVATFSDCVQKYGYDISGEIAVIDVTFTCYGGAAFTGPA